jgi:CheY-like chemotaxis protein
MSNFYARGVLANLITLAILLACLFIPAGTLDYWQAWVFVAVFGVSAQAMGIYISLGLQALDLGHLPQRPERFVPAVPPPTAKRCRCLLNETGGIDVTPCQAFAGGSLSSMDEGANLCVKKVLIVEDNYLIGEQLAAAIEGSGFKVIGPVATAGDAVCRIDVEALDGALLDVGLREGSVIDVARALRAHRVPFVIVSGYPRDMLPTALKDAPYLGKPVGQSELIEAARNTFKASARH